MFKKYFLVELAGVPNHPFGLTVQQSAVTSAGAARSAMRDWPMATQATAWIPGGHRGLDRTRVATITRERLQAEATASLQVIGF
jgi:hypothetical protein